MDDSGADRLQRYRSMRDFERTPEPAGADPRPDGQARFVVQEHHATALHWDFRLERDGVLVSWAVPKGIPAGTHRNNLAVHTEDHPMSYIDFEGQIPEGEYGGGKVILWDRGTYECLKWSDREVMVDLHGGRVRGRYVLFSTGGKNWMIHRMDPPEDPSREPMPPSLRPLVIPQGRLPADLESWAFEVALNGHRIVLSCQGGRVRAEDVDGEATGLYPELRALGRALGAVEVGLEGELVVMGPSGRPDPELAKRRSGAKSEAALRRLADRSPATFMASDIVWLEGHSTTALPYPQRRRLLDQLDLDGPQWRTTPSHPGEGSALLEASRQQGLPGVVARRLDLGYEREAMLFVPASPPAGAAQGATPEHSPGV